MQIRLLGPVEVWTGGGPLDAGTARQRCVLAALAVDAGRPVLVDTLTDRVWGEAPPARVRETIHVYIARIRKVLARAGTGAVSDPDGEAATRGSLGHAYAGLGRFSDAIAQFTRSIDLCRQVGQPVRSSLPAAFPPVGDVRLGGPARRHVRLRLTAVFRCAGRGR